MSNKPLIICYPACGTCKKAEKWLQENNIEYNYRSIKEEKPTVEELEKWIEASGLSAGKFFNTSGKLYRENNIKEKIKHLTDNELIRILASDGMMVKRPVLLYKNKALIGFNEDKWKTFFAT
jgi:arsenate reductase